MSNDVHLYRARTTTTTATNSGEKHEPSCTRRSKQHGSVREGKQENFNDYAFGSISPRSGNKQTMKGFTDSLESPEHSGQRDANESDNNISSCSTLDIVNKVDVQNLEKKISELTKSLEFSETACSDLQRKLEDCQAEKDVCLRRIEVISAAHECRITEMHCVIAELTKKLRAKQDNTILEEQEPDECGNSEISYQDGSICNSDMPTTNPDVERQTDRSQSNSSSKLLQNDYTGGHGFNEPEDDISNLHMKNLGGFKMYGGVDNVSKLQVEALQEEILELKAQIAYLQSQVLDSTKLDFKISPTKAEYDDCEKSTSSTMDKEARILMESNKAELNNLNKSPDHEFIKTVDHCQAVCTPKKELPKVAERIKLNCVSKMVEESVQEKEFLKNISNITEEQHYGNDLVVPPSMQHNLNNSQFQLEQLKLQNMMLSMNLDECKENCDHLYLLCGKYESNAVAMQIALNCSDRAIEAYDVMLALLESKIALIYDNSMAADESRNAVENVARHLLDRLESEINICENSLGPWQNTHFGNAKKPSTPWTAEDEKRLRYHVSKLKGTRASVQNTIVNLQAPFSGFYEKSKGTCLDSSEHDKEKSDGTERAVTVLMYEILQLREDNLLLQKKLEDYERDGHYEVDKNNLPDPATQPQLEHSHVQQTPSNSLPLADQHLYDSFAIKPDNNKQQSSKQEPAIKSKNDGCIPSIRQHTKEIEDIVEHKLKYEGRIRKLEKIVSDLRLELNRQAANTGQNRPQMQKHKYANNGEKSSHSQQDNVPETTL